MSAQLRENSYVVKLILAGDVEVGKTSLRLRYMGKGFSRNYLPTIGADFSHKSVQLDDYHVSFSIWDLAGQQRFQKIHPQYFRASLGALVVFDVTNDNSFDNLDYWVNRVLEFNDGNKTTLVIIGNKIDLINEEEIKSTEQNLRQHVQKLEERFPDFFFFGKLTSALSGEFVDDSFELVARNVINKINGYEGITQSTIDYQDDVMGIYTITNNPNLGPLITSSAPFNKRGTYEDSIHQTIASVINLFDFETDLDVTDYVSKVPWRSPSGIAYYTLAVDDAISAKKDRVFHLICIVLNHKYSNVLKDPFKSQVIRASLHMLKLYYTTLLRTEQLNFGNIKSNPLLAYAQTREKISVHLEKVRNELYNKLRSSKQIS